MNAVISFQEMQAMAEAVAKSGLFGMRTPEQALALMLVAQAEGRHPATITQDYDIIQGRAARKTHSVLARFQAAGGRVEWHRLDDEAADATFSHPQGGSLRLTWTIEQARRIGLASKDNWRHYPRAMLRARCIAEGVRAVYPAAIGGMLLSEEAHDLPAGDADVRMYEHKAEPRRSEQPLLLPYPADRFAENMPQWRGLVESGRKTPDDIIAMVQSRATLTPEQIAAIRDIAADAQLIAEPEETEQPE